MTSGGAFLYLDRTAAATLHTFLAEARHPAGRVVVRTAEIEWTYGELAAAAPTELKRLGVMRTLGLSRYVLPTGETVGLQGSPRRVIVRGRLGLPAPDLELPGPTLEDLSRVTGLSLTATAALVPQ